MNDIGPILVGLGILLMVYALLMMGDDDVTSHGCHHHTGSSYEWCHKR